MPYVQDTDPFTGISFSRYVSYTESFSVSGTYYPSWAEYQATLDFLLGVAMGWDPWGANKRAVAEPFIASGTEASEDIAITLPPPIPTTVPASPEDTSTPEDPVKYAEIREVVRTGDGEPALRSTGAGQFTSFSGWDNANAAIEADEEVASTYNTGAVRSATLTASGVSLNVPDDITITGIEVAILRRVI